MDLPGILRCAFCMAPQRAVIDGRHAPRRLEPKKLQARARARACARALARVAQGFWRWRWRWRQRRHGAGAVVPAQINRPVRRAQRLMPDHGSAAGAVGWMVGLEEVISESNHHLQLINTSG